MDDFDELMAECEIGDFSGFVLSDEEIKQAKKERKEQVESKVKELRELMAKAEQLEKEGKRLSNTDARKLKNLASDQLVVIAAMEDDVDIEELVDMENGDIKEERESGPSPAEMLELLNKGMAEIVETDGGVGIRRTEVTSEPVATKEKAYYKWEDGEPATIKCVTKKFWELNKHLDDSHSPENANLRKAFEEIGIFETSESVYEVNMTEEEMVSKMAEKGIIMRPNKIFCTKV